MILVAMAKTEREDADYGRPLLVRSAARVSPIRWLRPRVTDVAAGLS